MTGVNRISLQLVMTIERRIRGIDGGFRLTKSGEHHDFNLAGDFARLAASRILGMSQRLLIGNGAALLSEASPDRIAFVG